VLLLQDLANVFAERELAKCLALCDSLAIVANGLGFVVEIRLQEDSPY
jgi:hypothetical protein